LLPNVAPSDGIKVVDAEQLLCDLDVDTNFFFGLAYRRCANVSPNSTSATGNSSIRAHFLRPANAGISSSPLSLKNHHPNAIPMCLLPFFHSAGYSSPQVVAGFDSTVSLTGQLIDIFHGFFENGGLYHFFVTTYFVDSTAQHYSQ